TVTDNATNLSSTSILHIQICPLVASFNTTYAYSIAPQHTIIFNSTSEGINQIINHTWNLNDGTTSYQKNITHAFVSDGDYNVTLTVTDIYSNTHQCTKLISIEPNPPRLGEVSTIPTLAQPGTPVNIYADGFDNQSQLQDIVITMTYPDNSTENITMNIDGTSEFDYSYFFFNTWEQGPYFYTITATDAAGNTNISNVYSFHIGNVDYTLQYPPDDSTINTLNPTLSVTITNLLNQSTDVNVSFLAEDADITTSHLISDDNIDDVNAIDAADLDQDGDIDVIEADNNQIAWYKNTNGVFEKYIINSTSAFRRDIHAVDMDNDGDYDLLGCTNWYYYYYYPDYDVSWWENNGSGGFSQHSIPESFFARKVYPADLDGDGHMDIVGISQDSPIWWKNDGNGSFDIQYTHITYEGEYDALNDVKAADLDRDGDQDIIICGDNDLFWWENLENASLFVEHKLVDDDGYDVSNMQSVCVTDVDRDGFNDLITHGNKILCWYNDRNMDFNYDIISNDVYHTEGVDAADVDADGDTDIISTSNYTQATWWRNDGDYSFTRIDMDEDFSDPTCVQAVDMDADNDIDVIAADSEKIVWLENDQTFDRDDNVASGTNALYEWTDLSFKSPYFWRTAITINNVVEAGPLWCFHTGDISITSVSCSPETTGYGCNVTINATITTCDTNVYSAGVNITYPDQTIKSYILNHTTGDCYSLLFSDAWQHGQYYYYVWAISNTNNYTISSEYGFNVSANATVTIETLKDEYGPNEYVNLTDPPEDEDPSVDIPDVKTQTDEWYVTERGPAWIKYRNGTKPEYRIRTYGDLVNYKDEAGIYREINISTLTASFDGSYILNSTPYLFTLDSTRRFMTIYPDRNNKDRYVEMYMPSSFTMDSRPFWQNVPSFINAVGTIQWVSPNYDIQLRFDNSRFFFEIVLKNSLAATSTFNMTVIPHNMSYSDLNWINRLTDANDVTRPLTVTYNETTHILDVSINTVGLTYPITVDPSMQFYGLSQDCYISSSGTVYDTVWNASTGTISNSTTSYVGQRKSGSTYYDYRNPIYFNVDWDLPALATLTGMSLNLYVTASYLGDTKYLVIQNGTTAGYPHDPPEAGDYDKQYYGNDGGTKTSFSTNEYNAIPLNATGQSWIDFSGATVTKFFLRTSTDISGTAPTGNERLTYNSVNYAGTSYDPYLEVTYVYYVETSVDVLPSEVYKNPYDATVTGASGYDNVSLLYRYIDETGFSNRSLVNYSSDAADNSIVYVGGTSYSYCLFQTFYVPYDCYFGNLSMWMKKDESAATYYANFYSCNGTGVPNGDFLGSSGDSLDADMGLAYGWVSSNAVSSIFFKGGNTYGFELYVTPQAGSMSPPPYDGFVWVGYNESHDYDYTGGSRWNISTSYPPSYTETPEEDFLFKMNFSWIPWNDTSNPDTAVPWSFPFNFPDGNGVYEFRSLGCYQGFYENYSYNNDTWCHYQIQSKIENIGSTDIKGYLLIQVQYNNSGVWIVDNDTINETTPRTIIHGDQLALDQIFNGLVNTNDLQNGNGTYRVYAAFRDPYGDILKTDDDVELAAWYEFTIILL
ncbi:MAG: FG-GAP-like repeat-containing protein, partial [Euryarchaeota archaeon]|nr:FG-GAP-like repeat-containing protein [Euryarchaeota archaeon]